MERKNGKIDVLLASLVEASKKLYTRRLTSGISGNISARIPDHPNEILIKASGKSLGDITEQDFIRMDLDGNIIQGNGRPSVEVLFHCGIYRARNDVRGIVHGHSPYSTAYVTAKGRLPLVTAAAEIDLKSVAILPYAQPGSKKLADCVTETFRDTNLKAAILQGHGFITVGADIIQSYYLADGLEDNAKVACLIDLLGK
jgi:L-fuculose-phosphate aldolase